ncbi:MAG: PEP/pyruvate-binding domain-containing protein, partial [Desulforhabdus sp.]|nr:PEP/pyruvate-binding domain-containing protein [Desulforhabdus sp.]
MGNFISAMLARWRQRRRERADRVVGELKIRYHTFRIILTHNEISLNLLRSLDQSIRWPGSSDKDLAEETEELLNVTYELVDGLNRLTGDRYGALYEKFRSLALDIKKALAVAVEKPAEVLHCISFDGLGGDYRALVGGKAATLAMLKQGGFPVPDGFAITARACGRMIAENGLETFIQQRLQRLGSGRLQSGELEAEAAEIRRRILASSIQGELEQQLRLSYDALTEQGKSAISVRSSALVEDHLEHSFAGQFKSVLNVTSFAGFKEALREVVASNYSPRALL